MASGKEPSFEEKIISTYEKNNKKINNMIKTTDAHQLKDFLETADEVLLDKETGQHDYERFDTDKYKDKYTNQFKQKFSQRMARRHLKEMKVPDEEIEKILKDPIELSRRLYNFTGLTQDIINSMMLKHGKNFTYEAYQEEHGKKYIAELTENMAPAKYEHIDYEGMQKIVKHVTGGKIKTDLLTVRDRAALPYYLDNYLANKAPISDEVLKKGPHKLLYQAPKK
jgi:hypothetical protein